MPANNHIKCPVCHKNDQVVRIIYGYPSEKTMEDAEKGLIYIGGCIISNNSPKWYCKRDEKEFGNNFRGNNDIPLFYI